MEHAFAPDTVRFARYKYDSVSSRTAIVRSAIQGAALIKYEVSVWILAIPGTAKTMQNRYAPGPFGLRQFKYCPAGVLVTAGVATAPLGRTEERAAAFVEQEGSSATDISLGGTPEIVQDGFSLGPYRSRVQEKGECSRANLGEAGKSSGFSSS